ncbi:MAG: Xaa-Pro aminopeptidase [Burkholderiaceae bacterium]
MTKPFDPTPYLERRRRLAASMRERGGGVAIVATGAELMRNRDSDYPYRWDSYFYYLTGFPEPEAVLVIVADANDDESVLLCRDKDAERETWDGFRFGPEAARERFGFDRAAAIGRIDTEIPELIANRKALFHARGERGLDARVADWLDAVRAQARAGVVVPGQSWDVRDLLDEMRLIKDEHELSIMRRAGEISARAHRRAMQLCSPGRYEYEVEAELLHEFRRNGSQFPAYGSIVAGGAGACVLHYRANDALLRDGTLLLIDAGCELDGYASDITRTFPVNGRFSAAQRELYEVVLAAQHAAIDATHAGARFDAPHAAAVRVLTEGLVSLGLLQGSVDDAIETEAYRRFYMHRTSHWLGMDVHDCGAYREPGLPANGESRPWRQLEAGMVLTIEPGLYVRAADDVPSRFHDIGIRIEDDVVVEADGCEVITDGVPTAIAEIEALMRE